MSGCIFYCEILYLFAMYNLALRTPVSSEYLWWLCCWKLNHFEFIKTIGLLFWPQNYEQPAPWKVFGMVYKYDFLIKPSILVHW